MIGYSIYPSLAWNVKYLAAAPARIPARPTNQNQTVFCEQREAEREEEGKDGRRLVLPHSQEE